VGPRAGQKVSRCRRWRRRSRGQGTALQLKPATMLRVIGACDALRRPERLAQLLRVCELDAGAIARSVERERIAEAVRQARLAAVKAVLAAG